MTGASPISEKSLVDSPDDEETRGNSEDRKEGEAGDETGRKEDDDKGQCMIMCACERRMLCL